MNKTSLSLIASLAVAACAYWYVSYRESHHDHATQPDAHDHEAGEDHHDDEAQTSTVISAQAAQTANILAEAAGPQSLRETVSLNGKIILNPETSADVRARFAGVVRSVEKTTGETVRKGDILARVESNDSLQTYAVTSPLAGVVVSRNINVGDTAAEQTMFTIANLGSMVAELHVFPQDLQHIKVGQTMQVQTADGVIKSDGILKAILPTADSTTQTVVAWALLDNPQNLWRPGMIVQAGAVISEAEVPLAIRNEAIQNLNNVSVVFVKKDDTYTARTVKLGRSDGNWTEVTEGLSAGENYVTRNSFTVKADIGKAGAEHAH